MLDEQNDELTEDQRFWFRNLRACEVSGQTSIDYAKVLHGEIRNLCQEDF